MDLSVDAGGPRRDLGPSVGRRGGAVKTESRQLRSKRPELERRYKKALARLEEVGEDAP
jgi:hypothetical protein